MKKLEIVTLKLTSRWVKKVWIVLFIPASSSGSIWESVQKNYFIINKALNTYFSCKINNDSICIAPMKCYINW